jgi:hypothetical protein
VLQRVQPDAWLHVASAAVFSGKALLVAWSGSALAALAGYESLLGRFLPVGMPWEDYAVHQYPLWADRMDLLVLVACLLALLGHVWLPRLRGVVWAGGGLLLLETLAAIPGEYYGWAQFAGKTLLWATPWLLLCRSAGTWRRWAVLAVALVFASHGLFALGVLPSPGNYGDMTLWWLGEWALPGLRLAGFLDILAAALILLPWRVRWPVWAWLAGWGLLTALARLAGGLDPGAEGSDMLLALGEVLVRLPHAIVPALLWWQDRFGVS